MFLDVLSYLYAKSGLKVLNHGLHGYLAFYPFSYP